MPIDTTLNSEPPQALLGYGSCLWLKQRSLHQFLALMQIESVSHVHLLGGKDNVCISKWVSGDGGNPKTNIQNQN